METIIQDTARVVMKRKSDGHVVFTASAQLASISQSVDTQEIRGDWGNKLIATLKSNKALELTVRNATFNTDYLAMSQGMAFENGSALVYHEEESTLIDNAGEIEAPITGEIAAGGDVKVYDAEGKELGATNTGGTITVTEGQAGDKVTVVYQKDVTGRVLQIRGDRFSETYEIQYHTIMYSVETQAVIKDLYIQFDNVTPNDSFDLSFESGTPMTPEFTFTAKAPVGSSSIGRVIEVDREAV